MKTETDTEIVASNDARRRLMLRAMKEVRVKMGIKERTLSGPLSRNYHLTINYIRITDRFPT